MVILGEVRYFVSSRDPFQHPAPAPAAPQPRILFIESGSRTLSEVAIAGLCRLWPAAPIDLLTCYGGLPEGFPADTAVFRVTDYATPPLRNELIRTLRARDYRVAIMICSAEPIMTKWKWMLALRIPAKFLVVNENGDYFWLHRENLDLIRQFVLVRAGLHGAGALRTFARVLLFPFSLLFLLMYAFVAHTRRRLRLLFKT
jgi:hypothetical protein